ncbi:hypothetical protein K438DRAFT_1590157 [Mycena galopus ATCC 62051]|nr:hypothetical protein K438DRAFT_1590157 [Mycena galopus ATCC 62051]
MSQKLAVWEDRGWIGTPDRRPLQALAAELKQRTGKTTFEIQDQERTQAGIAGAVALAKAGCLKISGDNISFRIAPEMNLTGAKLATLTQAVAYAGIKELRKKVSRKATNLMVEQVQLAIQQEYSWVPTPDRVWKSLRHKDFTRQIRNFLWKSMHNAHRIGKYWSHIPDCEDRGICQFCEETEDLDHILLKCRRPGQLQVWDLAKSLFMKKHGSWPELSLGAILGCGLANIKDEHGRHLPGATRLYRILVSESLFSIWKIRNECVINNTGTPLSVNEIHNKWLFNINQRLGFECALTNHYKFGKNNSIKPLLVLQTWSSTLKGEDSLPENWLKVVPRVLVGIEPKRTSQPPSSRPQGRRGRNR